MAHGENAARQTSREYWSRRKRCWPIWGTIGKWITHRAERAAAKREDHKLKSDPEAWYEKRI